MIVHEMNGTLRRVAVKREGAEPARVAVRNSSKSWGRLAVPFLVRTVRRAPVRTNGRACS